MDQPPADRSARPVKPSTASPTPRTVGAPNSITSTSFDFHVGFFSVSWRESALLVGVSNRFSQVIHAFIVRPHQTPQFASKTDARTPLSIAPPDPNRGPSQKPFPPTQTAQPLKNPPSPPK